MNKIWYVEWKGKYTNKTYRLEVYSAGATLSSPALIRLDNHCVDIESLEWEFNEIPIGIMSDISLKVKWYKDYLHDAELKSILFNPIQKFQLPTEIDWVDFDAGNIYTIKIDNVVVYRGVQLTDEEFGFDGSKTYKAECISVAKHVLTCFDFKRFILLEGHLLRLHSKESPVIFEYYNKYNFNSYYLIAAVQGKNDIENMKSRYLFWSVGEIETWLKNALQFITNKLLRQTVNITFELPIAQYFKQNLTGNNGLGAILNKSQLYIVTYIVNNNKLVGGLFGNSSDSLANRYATLYDLLDDWAKSEGKKYAIPADAVEYKSLPILNDMPAEIAIDTKHASLKSLKKISYKQTTVSLEEFATKDIDNYRYNDGIPRNNNEIQTPMIFNSNAPVNSYKKVNASSSSFPPFRQSIGFINSVIELGNSFLHYSQQPIRMWNMYYFDMTDAMIEERAFKVHPFVESLYKKRVVGGFPVNSYMQATTTLSPAFDNKNAEAYHNIIQVEQPKASMFRMYNEIFGTDRTCKVSVDNPFNNNFNQGFASPNVEYSINLSDYDDDLSGFPSKFYITKNSYKFDTETFDAELIGVTL